ncbi:MAG: hypothetical protein PHW72_03315 [Candidatus Pacebacteria bacterium]|nr:hypothetical protein [Candidatus Paceibacterota bacterium]
MIENNKKVKTIVAVAEEEETPEEMPEETPEEIPEEEELEEEEKKGGYVEIGGKKYKEDPDNPGEPLMDEEGNPIPYEKEEEKEEPEEKEDLE